MFENCCGSVILFRGIFKVFDFEHFHKPLRGMKSEKLFLKHDAPPPSKIEEPFGAKNSFLGSRYSHTLLTQNLLVFCSFFARFLLVFFVLLEICSFFARFLLVFCSFFFIFSINNIGFMVIYVCIKCNKNFNRKSNYRRHLNRKNPCVNVEICKEQNAPKQAAPKGSFLAPKKEPICKKVNELAKKTAPKRSRSKKTYVSFVKSHSPNHLI